MLLLLSSINETLSVASENWSVLSMQISILVMKDATSLPGPTVGTALPAAIGGLSVREKEDLEGLLVASETDHVGT